jgi:hypothetical protein
MIENLKREIHVRRVLRRIARQRVALILKPGNIWVIENALTTNDNSEAEVATCLMRGWIEILEKSIRSGQLTKDGKLPDKPIAELFNATQNIYRITDSGWLVINRQNTIFILTLLIALMTLLFMIFK